MTGSGDQGLGADEKLNPEDGLHHDAEKGEGMKKVIYCPIRGLGVGWRSRKEAKR